MKHIAELRPRVAPRAADRVIVTYIKNPAEARALCDSAEAVLQMGKGFSYGGAVYTARPIEGGGVEVLDAGGKSVARRVHLSSR